MPEDVKLTVEQRLRSIGLVYDQFLLNAGLRDTILARMTYLSSIRKEFVADPLEDEDDQQSMLDHLTFWMKETEQAMNEAMAAAIP